MLSVMLKSKVTVPRNSILETQFSKTSRIEIRIVFWDAQNVLKASQNKEANNLSHKILLNNFSHERKFLVG